MKSSRENIITFSILLILSLSWCQRANGRNLHLIDRLPNGFKIYRSGVPSKEDLKEFRELGIQEIAVLSGDADRCELRYRDIVGGLKVVYNEKQDSHKPLTVSFLQWFDEWVREARERGRVIAIRCKCGCHRTGRLAAYYQMRYQGLSLEDALETIYEYGKRMFLHQDLKPQVRALEDYIRGRPCSQKPEYCVRDEGGAERVEPYPEKSLP